MKKILTFLLTLIFCTQFITSAEAEILNSTLTCAPTPVSEAHLKYCVKLGGGYRNAPTPPVIYDGFIITVSAGKLYKLNASDGSVVQSANLAGTNFYAVVAPDVSDNKIFVQLDGGMVQAFDFNTLTPLWKFTDPLGGQALCPILYDNGYIYLGFWTGETDNASFVCIDTEDSDASRTDEIKTAEWTYTSKGGFYWVKAVISGNFIIFGGDNGSEDNNVQGKITALYKTDGKLASSLNIKGDIRSGIFYAEHTGSFYTASKAGYIYKFSLNEQTGALTMLKNHKLPGEMTSTPVVHNNRLYAAYAKGAAGEFAALDADSLNTIYTSPTKGYSQGNILVCTYYESTDGNIYIYASYNTLPGGLTVFKDKNGQKSARKTELFAPPDSSAQYSISPVMCDSDGVLYYKNDSGCIFAVEETYEKLPVFTGLSRLITLISAVISKLINFCRSGAV